MSTVDGVAPGHGQQLTTVPAQDVTDEESAVIAGARGDAHAPGRWDDARALFTATALAEEHDDVLAVPAHERMP